MASLISFIVLSFLLCPWANAFTYGVIRDVSIDNPFNWTDKHGFQLNETDCNKCLCHLYRNSTIALFTCDRTVPTQCLCQFYYSMPKLEDLDYPTKGVDIYLAQSKTFEEGDDCCNTSFLMDRVLRGSSVINETRALRSLIEGDSNTLVSVVSDSLDSKKLLVKYEKSTLQPVYNSKIAALKAVGYYDGKYYLGMTSNEILIYDQNLTKQFGSIPIGREITTIRFLYGKQMLVGASTAGVFIYNKDNDGIFRNRTTDGPIYDGQQVHGIGVLNETAFYVGVDADNAPVRLYVQQGNGTWTESVSNRINTSKAILDLVVDNCQRLWTVQARNRQIEIHALQRGTTDYITVDQNTFNMVILDNYDIIISHETSGNGLTSLKPKLNCRRPRFKPMRWRKRKTFCRDKSIYRQQKTACQYVSLLMCTSDSDSDTDR